MARFVSVLGPDVSLDVYFLKSVANYKDALAAKEKLDSERRRSDATTVIYRQAYSELDHQLYASRQTRPDENGDQRINAEPKGAVVVGYDLFSTPASLLVGTERALTASVERILTYSHGHVGSAGTPK